MTILNTAPKATKVLGTPLTDRISDERLAVLWQKYAKDHMGDEEFSEICRTARRLDPSQFFPYRVVELRKVLIALKSNEVGGVEMLDQLVRDGEKVDETVTRAAGIIELHHKLEASCR